MRLQAAAATDVGRRRRQNEDFFVCDVAKGLFVVCDGMGGALAGEVAARYTGAAIDFALSPASTAGGGHLAAMTGAECLRAAIEHACAVLHRRAQHDVLARGMGTTCTALLIEGTRATLAHVGDSRCYLLRHGVMTQLTSDHTCAVEAVQLGILTPDEVDQSPFANLLTRAIGTKATVQVDLRTIDVAPGDVFLLCSDGLHRYVSSLDELARTLDARDLRGSVVRLLELARDRGGHDDITVLAVGSGLPQPSPHDDGADRLAIHP